MVEIFGCRAVSLKLFFSNEIRSSLYEAFDGSKADCFFYLIAQGLANLYIC